MTLRIQGPALNLELSSSLKARIFLEFQVLPTFLSPKENFDQLDLSQCVEHQNVFKSSVDQKMSVLSTCTPLCRAGVRRDIGRPPVFGAAATSTEWPPGRQKQFGLVRRLETRN